MAQVIPVVSDFSLGEISPKFQGRSEQAAYYKGCQTLDGFIPELLGGFSRCPSTTYVGATKSNGKARLIPFVISQSEAYVLEFGNDYIRVWRDGAQVTNGSGSALEYTTTYTTSELWELQYASNYEDLFIAHPSHAPARLRRSALDTFTLADIPITGTSGSVPFGTSNNYPACVSIAWDRAWWANTNTEPQTLWGTRAGIYDDSGNMDFTYYSTVSYTVSEISVDSNGDPVLNANGQPQYTDVTNTEDVIADDDAIKITLNSDTTDAIQWISTRFDMIIGTATGEWIVPYTINANSQLAYLQSRVGSEAIQARLIEDGVVFIQKGYRKVRSYQWTDVVTIYSTPKRIYTPKDLTMFSDHIPSASNIVEMSYSQTPENIVWFVHADGTLSGLVLDSDTGVNGWFHRVTRTNDTFISACVVPESNRDVPYFLTYRNSTYMIEKMADPDWDTVDQAHNVDAGVYYDSTTATTITGLTHLAGLTCGVVADGVYIGVTAPTTSGTITLSTGASRVHVGLEWDATMEILPIQVPQVPTLTQMKTYNQVRVQVIDSLYFKIGPSTSEMFSADIGASLTAGTVPTPLTASYRVPVSGGYDRDSIIRVVSDKPYPVTVTALIPELTVGN